MSKMGLITRFVLAELQTSQLVLFELKLPVITDFASKGAGNDEALVNQSVAFKD